ncbi:Concanavalin A-like lectin/glucanases superfamily protein [uncultured archaeon]|nr:Concanavalin A-like lectin/glucanases superfamily protein [uncultured archaeon]
MADVRKDGLVGYWKFDEGQGTAAHDSSGNGNDGMLLPAGSPPQWVDGKLGKGLQFDGVGDYVNAGASSMFNMNNVITIETWVYPSPSSSFSGLVSKKQWDGDVIGYHLARTSTGNIYFAWGNGTVKDTLASAPVPNNIWTNVVATFDNGKSSIYINGINTSKTSAVSSIANTGYYLSIGSTQGATYPFNGTIDEVRIYNKALTPDDTISLRAA